MPKKRDKKGDGGCRIRQKFKGVDIFGYPVHMNFDQKSGGGAGNTYFVQPSHPTCVGGLLTLVFLIIMIVMFAQVVNEEPIYINQQSTYPASTKLLALQDDPSKYDVQMIFSVEQNGIAIDFERDSSLQAKYKNGNNQLVDIRRCSTNEDFGGSELLLQKYSQQFVYCVYENSARSLEIYLKKSSLSERVVVSSLISKRWNSQEQMLETYESKPQYTVLNTAVNQRSMVEIQENKFRDDDSTFYSYSGYRTNSFSINKSDKIIYQAQIALQDDGNLIWSDMLSDPMYKKLAIFTSLVIFYYAVFTIVVRPIAKHSFILRAAKRLYAVNQELEGDITPELLKPAKGEKHPEKPQTDNKNKKRGESAPKAMNKNNQRAQEYRQDDESFEDTPNEHHRQPRRQGQRGPNFSKEYQDSETYQSQYSGGEKEKQQIQKGPVKHLKNQKIRIRCCEKWKELCFVRLGIFCSKMFCNVRCACCTSILRCLCCCCFNADKIGPYTNLYEQAIDKIQKDFDIIEHVKSRRIFEASLKALALLDKKRLEKMQYVRDCVIDVDLDPEATEEDVPKMKAQIGIDYNVFDRNIEALIGGDQPLATQEPPEILNSKVNDSKVMGPDNTKKKALPSFGKPKIPRGKIQTPEYPEGNTGAFPTHSKRGPPQGDYVQRRNDQQNSYGDSQSIESYSTNNPPPRKQQQQKKQKVPQSHQHEIYEDYNQSRRSERESKVSHRDKSRIQPSNDDHPFRSPRGENQRGRSAVNTSQNRRDSFKQMQGDPRDRGLSAYIKSPQERFQYSQQDGRSNNSQGGRNSRRNK